MSEEQSATTVLLKLLLLLLTVILLVRIVEFEDNKMAAKSAITNISTK